MSRELKRVFVIIWCVSGLSMLSWFIVCLVLNVQFNRDIGGHLKRAADSSGWSMAMEELDLAVKNMEKRGLTQGYTSMIYQTPNEDIGFWYKNIKTANDRLHNTNMMSQTEADMALLKLRQVLLDKGEKGEEVTKPKGIARYPLNWLYAVWAWISLISFGISSLVLKDNL